MRGVEEMFIPLDNPEVDSLYTSGQLKSLKEQERRKAKEQVYQGLKVCSSAVWGGEGKGMGLG